MTSTTFPDDIGVWEAFNDPGEPLCVAQMNDKGLSISVYYDEDGIYGVDIFDEGATEPVCSYGYLAEGESTS